MDFTFTPTRQIIADSVRDFAKQHIAPNLMQWDEKQYFPVDLFKKLGELGFMGVFVPETYGGSQMDYHDYIVIIEEISKVCPSIGLSVASHNSLCINHILTFGNEKQKQKWLPKLATGQWIGAWSLTEQNAGSDAKNVQTKAVQQGDYFILNGSKNFITHAISGDIAIVIARTGKKGDSHEMTAFAIEKNTDGLQHGEKINKLGMRASETAELIFNNCKVHKSNVLGNIGEGFMQAMKILDGGRVSIAALSLGICKGAYNAALKYAKEREQFGKAIAKFQAISFKLADMLTKIEAAELLTHKAAYLMHQGKSFTQAGAIAKMFASEACVEIACDAVQIHGGYGYTKDYPVEKFYRDSKLCTIGEGTTEIQKLVISRGILH